MNKLNRFVHRIIACLIILMTLVGGANAVLRYLGRYIGTNLSSNVFIELQWYLFSIVFLLGGTCVLAKNEHIRVDILYNRLSPKAKRITDILGGSFLLFPLCCLMFYVSVSYFLTSFEMLEESSDSNGLPRYLIKFFIPLSFGYMGVNVIFRIFKLFKPLSGEDES